MSIPTVSVIIPAYNRARYIAEAVHSVLQQTIPVFEVLVVDDGSTDATISAVPAHPKVRVIARPHAGIAPTVNHGVSQARGDVLAFLDSDDRWIPHKLELQLARLDSHAAPEIIFGQARIFQEGQPAAIPEETVNGVSKSALLLHRTVFDRIGSFPENPGAHDFLDWYARAQELNIATHVIPEVLFERRVHDQNDGLLQKDRQRANYFASLKTMLDRRRNSQTS